MGDPRRETLLNEITNFPRQVSEAFQSPPPRNPKDFIRYLSTGVAEVGISMLATVGLFGAFDFINQALNVQNRGVVGLENLGSIVLGLAVVYGLRRTIRGSIYEALF